VGFGWVIWGESEDPGFWSGCCLKAETILWLDTLGELLCRKNSKAKALTGEEAAVLPIIRERGVLCFWFLFLFYVCIQI
jgi:hypothetical protein